jgi:hypothetical protein
MWDRLLDDYGFTWKDLARLYKLKTLSGYKLNSAEIVTWHTRLSFGNITWGELYQLFKVWNPVY